MCVSSVLLFSNECICCTQTQLEQILVPFRVPWQFSLVLLANIALNASQANSCSWTCIPNSRKKVPVALVLPCGLHGTSMPTCGPSLLRACHGPCASCMVVSLKGALEGCIINRSPSTARCQGGAQTSTGHMLESCFCTLWYGTTRGMAASIHPATCQAYTRNNRSCSWYVLVLLGVLVMIPRTTSVDTGAALQQQQLIASAPNCSCSPAWAIRALPNLVSVPPPLL